MELSVANMLKTHFQELYRGTTDNDYRKIFYEKVSGNTVADMPLLTVYDILEAISSQKRGKAAGPDGIQTEAFD